MTKPVTSAVQEQAVADLEVVLRELLGEHEGMLEMAAAHKAAISGADGAALARCVQRHNEAVQRVAALESRRMGLVARIADGMKAGTPPGADKTVTVSWIARALPEPARERVMGLADRLREVLKRLHREQVALRDGAAAVAAHMEGVLRQVAGRLSHAGTYGRRGAVETSVQVVSGLDLRH